MPDASYTESRVLTTNDEPILIGGGSGYSSPRFPGIIDELIIHNKAIDPFRDAEITVTRPNGGEQFTWDNQKDTEEEITWTSNNTTGIVKIELSRNNGTSWETITESTEDDGSYLWTVTLPISNFNLVRISDTAVNISDQSDSTFSIKYPTGVNLNKNGLPKSFALYQNYPNPFNTETKIVYQLPKKSPVKIFIINTLGQHVCTIIDDLKEAGTYNYTWSGKNNQGFVLPSGIYFCKMIASDFQRSFRMVLLK